MNELGDGLRNDKTGVFVVPHENGRRVVDSCAERCLYLGNTFQAHVCA